MVPFKFVEPALFDGTNVRHQRTVVCLSYWGKKVGIENMNFSTLKLSLLNLDVLHVRHVKIQGFPCQIQVVGGAYYLHSKLAISMWHSALPPSENVSGTTARQ